MTQSSLMSSRRFFPLFWTQFLGAFNDNFLKNAMVILITYRAGSILGIPAAQVVALSGGIFILPFFLFSATAGQIADKFEKARVIRIVKLAEIAIMGLAGAGFLTGSYGVLLGALFLMGVHSTFFGPIKYSILPQQLEEEELVGGNALIEAGTFLAILLGTIAGGVLIAQEDAGLYLVSAGLLLVAALGYFFSRKIPAAAPVDPGIRIRWSPISPTVEVFRLARGTPAVFLSILGISWFWFLGAVVFSIFPAYCKDVLHGDPSVATLFLTVFSVGIGLGSLACEKLSRRKVELGLVPFGSIGITFFAAWLGFEAVPHFACAPPFVPYTAADFLRDPEGLLLIGRFLGLSVFSGLFIVPLYAFIQERSAPRHRSRIIAANNILNAAFMVVASVALATMLRFELSVRAIFMALAVLNGLVAIYIYTLIPEFLARFMMWILVNLVYRLRVTGESNIPSHGPVLLICNHVSFVDWMFISAAVPRPARFVMDHGYFKGFLLKRILTQVKVIPIARASEDPALLERAFERIADELRDGAVVCIFPEGTITRAPQMSPFRPGVLRIVGQTPVPIVPMALGGVWGSFFSRKGGRALAKRPRRFWSRIELRIDVPVSPEGVTLEDLAARVERLWKQGSP